MPASASFHTFRSLKYGLSLLRRVTPKAPVSLGLIWNEIVFPRSIATRVLLAGVKARHVAIV